MRGGVIGLILAEHQATDGLRWRRTGSLEDSLEVVFRHIDRMHEITGSHRHAAIGSDLDGFIKPTLAGLDDASRLGTLPHRRWSSATESPTPSRSRPATRCGCCALTGGLIRGWRVAAATGRAYSYVQSSLGRRTLPASVPGSVAGPSGAGIPSTRIALSPRPSFSRPSVEKMSSPQSSLHALEPVADRVAVGEQALGGRRDVAVVLQKGLDGDPEVGLVLLVVGDQRRDRLLVEALQLAGVLAQRRQQQPVGARLLEASTDHALGLADVRRELRLLAGAVEVDGVGRERLLADGDREARQRRRQLALEARRGARELRRRRARHDRRDLGRLAVAPRRERAAARRPQRPHRERQHALAPLARLRERAARRARRPRRRRPPSSAPSSAAAGEHVAAVGELARRAPRARSRR